MEQLGVLLRRGMRTSCIDVEEGEENPKTQVQERTWGTLRVFLVRAENERKLSPDHLPIDVEE
jgi:hypothetical protein